MRVADLLAGGESENLYLFDRSAAPDNQALTAESKEFEAHPGGPPGISHKTAISVAGRTWEVIRIEVKHLHWQALFLLSSLLVLTGLLAAYVNSVKRRGAYVEGLVSERTKELLIANHNLELEMEERLWVEEELITSESGLRAILDTTADAIITIDAEGGIISFNKAAESVFGYRDTEIIGENVKVLMCDPVPSEHDGHPSQRSGVEPWTIIGGAREGLGQRKDGEAFPMDIAVSAVQLSGRQIFTGIVRDITARKMAEDSLHRKNDQFQGLIDAIPDLMLRLGSDGGILDYSQSNDTRMWASPSRFDGSHLQEVFSAPLALELLDNVIKALDSGNVMSFECELDLGCGSRDVEARIATSGPEEALVIMRDITEQKAAEQAKNRLVSTVSHELRTPLTSIKGISELLLQEENVGEEDRLHSLGIIDEEADRLTSLINDFLDIAKIDSGIVEWNDQPTEIGSVVWPCIDTVTLVAENKNISIQQSIDDGLPLVHCDPHRLRQVMVNLLGNAIKFTGEGGHISISAKSALSKDHEIGEHLVVQVKDSGIGIDAENREKIFERFTQVGRSSRGTEGTGLGLAICQEILEHYEGKIWVESEPGEGSTFIFTLPLRQVETAANADGAAKP